MNRKLIVAFFTSGVLLILYAHVARILNIFFFWDSDVFGFYILFLTGLILCLIIIRKRKKGKKSTIVSKYISVLLLFLIILYSVLLITLGNSNAVKACKLYSMQNDTLRSQIGNITGFGFDVSGSLKEAHIGDNQESGRGSLTFVVKGEKKFKDVSFMVVKESYSEWKVVNMKIHK